MVDKVTGALPTIATGASTDPEYQKEYFEALNQSLKALEGRQQPNLMQIASAFMNPGRTGSFGEALGNAMGVVGKQQEEAEARAPAIAQMRAALAGQKYEVGKEQNALKAFANVLGVAPDNIQEGMAQAVNSPAMMQRLNAAMPQFYGSPKIFEMAKTMFGQYKDINEANIKQQQLTIDAVKAGASGSEAFYKTGQDPSKFLPPNLQSLVTPPSDRPVSPVLPYPVSGATISSGYGERKSPTGEGKEMHPAVDFSAPLGSKVEAIMPGTVYEAGTSPTYGNFVKVKTQDGAIIQYSHLQGFGDEIKPGAQVNVGTPIGQVGSTGTSTGSHVDVRAFDAKGNPFNLQPYFARPQQAQAPTQATSGATPETQQKILQSMTEGEMKDYSDKRQEILKFSPVQLKTQMGDYDNLMKYLTDKKYSRVVGILQQKDPKTDNTLLGDFVNKIQSGMQALGAAGEKGITMGQFGSISLPVEEMVRTYKLSEQERVAFNEIQRIIKSGLISSIAQSGKVLGTNPTDADARLFEAAAASTSNLAANTIYWAQMRRAQTEFLHDITRAQREYGLGKHPGMFFTDQNSPYMRAENNFYNNMDRIQSKAPGLSQ